ncbi:PIN domain-containing protein [Candidatus Aquiluna sp. UB-MaderosW2red]|nr:PIN domain-containing protein [Candidatus Aquiluna sp. UB-MaderosW2red]
MFTALVDANVWYSKLLRDALLEFGLNHFFQPRWSQNILDETQGALERRFPGYGLSFKKQAEYMNLAFPEAMVGDFEHLETGLQEVHENDKHVLAAALACKAGALVTFNLKDFPQNLFEVHGVQLVHPDDFLLDQVDLNPQIGLLAIAKQLADYRRPHIGALELSTKMKILRCPGFAEFVAEHSDKIDYHVSSLRENPSQ